MAHLLVYWYGHMSCVHTMYVATLSPYACPCRCPSSEKKKGESGVCARALKEAKKARISVSLYTGVACVCRVSAPGPRGARAPPARRPAPVALARGSARLVWLERSRLDRHTSRKTPKKQNKHNKPTLKTMTRCPRATCAMHGVWCPSVLAVELLRPP